MRNEYDANRALAATVNKSFRKELKDAENYSDDFARGILTGMAQLATDLRVTLDTSNLKEWCDYNRKRA